MLQMAFGMLQMACALGYVEASGSLYVVRSVRTGFGVLVYPSCWYGGQSVQMVRMGHESDHHGDHGDHDDGDGGDRAGSLGPGHKLDRNSPRVLLQ
jgi:hypothetical protein